MRNSTIIFCLLFLLFLPLNSQGAQKTVTVTWTMSDTSDVTGYRLYYAYNPSMTDKLLACEDTSDPSLTSLTCANVDLLQSPVYFTVAAITTSGERTSTGVAKAFTESSTISMVQGFMIEISPVKPTQSPDYKINFQPSDVPVPEGYQVDSGEPFNADNSYGWMSGPSSDGLRDRDNAASPDQAYDTMIHVRPTSKWEIALPNGSYTVTVCAGDASFPTGVQNIQAEGVPIIDDTTLSTSSPWVERTASVTVDDGRLSITFTGSTDPARLCWLTITSNN